MQRRCFERWMKPITSSIINFYPRLFCNFVMRSHRATWSSIHVANARVWPIRSFSYIGNYVAAPFARRAVSKRFQRFPPSSTSTFFFLRYSTRRVEFCPETFEIFAPLGESSAQGLPASKQVFTTPRIKSMEQFVRARGGGINGNVQLVFLLRLTD